ncbi:hypothetical protein ACFQPG_11125 [Sphingomonas sp. GCM10030256]|uniref:hypothetical protein n=1 Tax=Sphingomonas sp. GCM10030256 TaxID=3273427 RepID=UPI00361541A4
MLLRNKTCQRAAQRGAAALKQAQSYCSRIGRRLHARGFLCETLISIQRLRPPSPLNRRSGRGDKVGFPIAAERHACSSSRRCGTHVQHRQGAPAGSGQLPIETFTILYYGEGQADGFFGEIDEDTWIERRDGSSFIYTELSETPDQVVLFDESRQRTVTIDWPTFDLTIEDNGSEVTYEVTDFSKSLLPFVPPESWV